VTMTPGNRVRLGALARRSLAGASGFTGMQFLKTGFFGMWLVSVLAALYLGMMFGRAREVRQPATRPAPTSTLHEARGCPYIVCRYPQAWDCEAPDVKIDVQVPQVDSPFKVTASLMNLGTGDGQDWD
jgi:hypothetical protein